METIRAKTFILRFLLMLFALIILRGNLICQSCYSSFIDSIISQVSLQNISNYNQELTGELETIVGGQPCRIISRYWESPFNQKAAQYIYEKFQSFGLETRYQIFSSTGVNVLAKKTGAKYPNQQIIICAHYDNITYMPVPDTVYGADDDASGACAVLEAAGILKNYTFDYTIVFAAWDEEESPVILSGSRAYADSCFAHGDSIICVLNLDMTAWDGNYDNVVRIGTNTNSSYYAAVLESLINVYCSEIIVKRWSGGWDESSFWNRGYKGILFTEDENHLNPNYHQVTDRFSTLNLPYFLKTTQAAVAFLSIIQKDYIININHEPLQSSFDTTSRIVAAVITSNHPIDRNVISKRKGTPKLYWRVGSGPFILTNAIYCNLDTFKFIIPGQPAGSTVSYYIAVQDSLATMIGSLPGGAKGLNPPGTISPPTHFVYSILKQMNVCSQTVPKSLPPRQVTYDTIKIIDNGIINDYDLNLTVYHTNDSDIYIILVRSGSSQIQLSTGNGGNGQNYFNTTFDDESEIAITEGVPPFIGSYRPEMPLSNYDKLSIAGEWVLRIFNNSNVVTGNLANWCLSFDYYDPIGISNYQIPVKCSLSQNYPNPFNSGTIISFSLVERSNVKITVYDIIGRVVGVLTNNDFNSGTYHLNFSANNLASGLYFYTMYLDGSLFETKKMVLIK